MRTVDVDKFVPFVTQQAETCPAFLARNSIIATVADMCTRIGLLSMDSCFSTEPGQAEYELSTAEGTHLTLIRALYYDGTALRHARMDDLARYYGGADWSEAEGVPMFYTFKHKNKVILTPTPSEQKTVRVIAQVSVNRDTAHIPEEFYEEYLDIVVRGALARVYRVAGQTYSNNTLANECQTAYELGLNRLRAEAYRDFTRGDGRVFFNRII